MKQAFSLTPLKERIKRPLLRLPGISELVRIYTRIPHGPDGISRVGHRNYVGGLWEEVGQLQFEFLLHEGLQPHHILLDIGCGSLRGGVFFIPFLDPGHYLGIDKEKTLIQAGLEQELSEDLMAERKPSLLVSESFEFYRFGVRPDYALALSVFTHLPPDRVHLCCRNLRKVLKESGLFFASYFESRRAVRNPAQPHDHALFRYTQTQIEEFGQENGWRTEYLGGWGHPRGQVMVRYLPC